MVAIVSIIPWRWHARDQGVGNTGNAIARYERSVSGNDP